MITTPVVGVIVAAGSGLRLGGSVPKALREIAGRSLVARSADALVAGGCTHLVIVVAEGLRPLFEAALAGVPAPITYATGGARRQDSVVAGLQAIAEDARMGDCEIVLVHDAARALVPAAVVGSVIGAVRDGAAAVIPVTPMIDSVRRERVDGSEVVDRHDLRLVQTPQGFNLPVLVASHQQALAQHLEVTDDAAVCEATGHPVVLVPGSRDAMKVTEPFDVLIAEAICRQREHASAALSGTTVGGTP